MTPPNPAPRHALLIAATVWTNAAMAKLPAAVDDGPDRLALAVVSFFVVPIACAIAGAVVSRRLAPSSQSRRRLIFAIFAFVGLVAGALIAFNLARQ